MTSAIQLIVDGYVQLADRKALEELRNHREKLLTELRQNTGLDHTRTLRQFEEEIAVIEAGLGRIE